MPLFLYAGIFISSALSMSLEVAMVVLVLSFDKLPLPELFIHIIDPSQIGRLLCDLCHVPSA